MPLLIDEAHDFNSCALSILFNNFHKGIIVYDPHQSIYQFRGAVDTRELDSLNCTYTRKLNLTFRFGFPLNNLISKFIRKMKKEYLDFEIISDINKQTSYSKVKNYLDVKVKGRCLLLARTNVGLIYEMFFILKNLKDVKFFSLGGSNEFKNIIFDLQQMYELMKTGRGKDKFKKFTSFEQMQKKYYEENNISMLSKIKFVKDFNNLIPQLVNIINKNLINDFRQANIILSTTHKAKGYELDYVYLSNDYLMLDTNERNDSSNNIEEINILNVALTRARFHLFIHEETAKRINKEIGEILIK